MTTFYMSFNLFPVTIIKEQLKPLGCFVDHLNR